MGDQSAIEWTEATWNPLVGCSRVSEGCRHCYAERQAFRAEVRFIRAELGLTRRALAKRMGISPNVLAGWETGQAPVPVLGARLLFCLYRAAEAKKAPRERPRR